MTTITKAKTAGGFAMCYRFTCSYGRDGHPWATADHVLRVTSNEPRSKSAEKKTMERAITVHARRYPDHEVFIFRTLKDPVVSWKCGLCGHFVIFLISMEGHARAAHAGVFRPVAIIRRGGPKR